MAVFGYLTIRENDGKSLIEVEKSYENKNQRMNEGVEERNKLTEEKA